MLGLECRAWLEQVLAAGAGPLGQDRRRHAFRAEPAQRRSALRPAADDGQLLQCRRRPDPRADLWLHGHLHCRHDYLVERAGGAARVVCQARGLARRGEPEGHRPAAGARSVIGRRAPARPQKVERRCSRYCMRLGGRARSRAATSAADSGWMVVIASSPKAVPMSAGSSSTRRAVRREVDR